MPVNRSSGGIAVNEEYGESYYGDLEHQFLGIQDFVLDTELDGSTGQAWTDTQAVSPVSETKDLQRGQVAELVAIDYMGGELHCEQQSGQGSTPGSFSYESFGFLSDPGKDTTADTDMKQTVNENDGTANSATMKIQEQYVKSGAFLWFARSSSGTPFNDTVNGTGGGSSGNTLPAYRLPFRQMYGVGPLTWWDDNLKVEVQRQIKADQIDTEGITAKCGVGLVWDVHEVDDSGVQELEDTLGLGRS